MRLVARRKIEVLRKPVCFEKAFLETGAALEDPALSEFFMRVDTGDIQPRT
jgi:hypothetical protein